MGRRSDDIEFYSGIGPPGLDTFDKCLAYVVNGIITVFTSSQLRFYPRHRWIGMDLALDEQAVMEACHRLLSCVYCRFTAAFLTGGGRVQLMEHLKKLRSYNGLADRGSFALADDSGGCRRRCR